MFDSGFNVMAVNRVGQEIISSLHRHPEVSLEVVEVETLLILKENLFDFLLDLGDPVSRCMFSVPDLLQYILFVRLRLEK